MTIDTGDLALLILFVLCLAIFVYLLIKVLKGRAIRIDEVGYLLLVERLRSPVLTAAMKAASSFGVAAVCRRCASRGDDVGAQLGPCCLGRLQCRCYQRNRLAVKGPCASTSSTGISACRGAGAELPLGPLDGGHGVLWLWYMVGAVLRVWPSVRRRHRGCTRVRHPCGGRQPCLSGRALRFGCAGLVLPVFCLAHPVRASWPLDFDRLIVATGRHVGSNLILTQP